MRIENGDYNISVKFMSRAKDGLNVWDEFKEDNNSLEIFLGFSVKDGFGSTEGMCIPLQDIYDLYNGLLSIVHQSKTYFNYSKQLPFKNCEDEFFSVSVKRINNEISFLFRIYDNLCDYVELTEIMSETKFLDIITELKSVIDKYPII